MFLWKPQFRVDVQLPRLITGGYKLLAKGIMAEGTLHLADLGSPDFTKQCF